MTPTTPPETCPHVTKAVKTNLLNLHDPQASSFPWRAARAGNRGVRHVPNPESRAGQPWG